MRRTALALPALFVLIAGAPAPGGEIVLDGHRFVLPEGFTIERAAARPLVDRPITAAFDEQGRLYVADSSGTNDNVQKQLAERPHRIVRLEDTDGDGRFDKSVVFADKMMFPEGTMWLDGSLYVAAPPQIWKLTDTDGDGRADKREVWFDGKTLTGCANDLHGPYPGPDGRIYWAKGAFAEQSYDLRGPAPFKTRAAHIFRARPDGTEVEPVMTGGMDNPVDVVFTPGGERLVNGTFFVNPGGGRRDGILHAIYGGVYGKLHDPIYDPIHKWTGPEVMPILVHLGPAAPSGLHRFESDHFGPAFKDNVFSTCFNLHKVTRHVLGPQGATFATEDSDFLVAADGLDFHPTDLVEDADGSLLVVDTGGWYKLCCPTSQLHKPDILGAIYRVRRTDTSRAADPRGLKLAWDTFRAPELVGLLGDMRPAVRERATRALAQPKRAQEAVAALAKAIRDPYPVGIQRQAVWAATRIDDPGARALTRSALTFRDDTVRQAALHAVALWRDAEAVPQLLTMLEAPGDQNRRAAAEALGRIGDARAVAALLRAVAAAGDRVLEHSLIYAVIEIGKIDAVQESRKAATDAKVRRAALIALDQIDSGFLTAERIMKDLKSADAATREAAWWIAGRHPEWGDALADILRDELFSAGIVDFRNPPMSRDELEARLAHFAKADAVRRLLADHASTGPDQTLVLRAMARSAPKELPAGWDAGIAGALRGGNDAVIPGAIAAARALPATKEKPLPKLVSDALRALGHREDAPADQRLQALAAIPQEELDVDLFAFLVANLKTDLPVTTRAAAADVLARSKLDAGQLAALADAIRTAGPLEVGRLLGAFEGASDDAVGRKLVAALEEAPALPALRVEQIQPRLAKFGPDVRQAAESLYARLNVDAAAQRAKIEELLKLVPSGDIRRGQAVFAGAKAACVSCHQMGYVGGKVGPDLTRIGAIRAERDLLEAIVYPSASFVRSYEPMTIATRDGRVFNGIPKKDAADEIILATTATEEARIPRADIEELRPGTVSVMPAGLDQQLTPQELADLVAFLKASNR